MKRLVLEVIYFDMSVFIVFFNRNDKNYERVVFCLREVFGFGNFFFFLRLVFMEYLNGLFKRYGKEIVKENYDVLILSSFVYIENEMEVDWRKVWEFFFKYCD